MDRTPETLKTVCDHISNGGSLVDLCTLWKVRFCDMVNWLNEKPNQPKYFQAITAQNEWAIQRILTELRSISFADKRLIFQDDGTLKPIKDWPEEVARAIDGIEVEELITGMGVLKKVKLASKLKSLEMMMKNLGILTDRTLTLTGSIEDKKFAEEFFGIKKQEE